MAFWLHCYPELYFMKTKRVGLPDQPSFVIPSPVFLPKPPPLAFQVHPFSCLSSCFSYPLQDKIYSKVVLYTSSLLMIGGAYIVK